MPFLRTKSHTNNDGSKREYVFLVEGFRDETGKVRQKTLGCVGRLDILRRSGSLRTLKNGIEKLISGRTSLKAIKESSTFKWARRFGSIFFLREIWKKWKYQSLFDTYLVKWSEAIFCMVANRLLDPASKLGIEDWKKKYYVPAWDKLRAHTFYRAMDDLIKLKDVIERHLANQVITLFSGNISMVMFDTTSVKHWGEGEYADVLEWGYSKEKRGDLPQIIVGALMTADGIPFGHEVWKGNQSDIKSFAETIKEAKEKYNLKEVIWVADRGMVSEKNIELLEKLELDYILGVRMRHLESEIRDKLLCENFGFKTVNEKLKVKNMILEGQRYVVCFNPIEAKKQKKKRDAFKKILQKKVADNTIKKFMTKNGYKKYLKVKGKIEINWERFDKEEIYDGKWVLITNNCELTEKEIGRAYKDLWQIERSFRIIKSPLAVDPMFHWTEKRIRAHIFICFIALQIYLLMHRQLKEKKQNLSIQKMLDELDQIQSINQILEGGESIIHLTEVSERAEKILKQFNLPKPASFQRYNVKK